MRRSHSAQHGDDDDETDINKFRRNISGRHIGKSDTSTGNDESIDNKENQYVSLEQMINEHGFATENEPTLKTFIKYHQGVDEHAESHDVDVAASETMDEKRFLYIGDPDPSKETCCQEYLQYAKPQDAYSESLFRQEAFEEFKDSLNALSLNVDDVGGIQKLAESAHIGRFIKSGQYKGLHQKTSAIEVATVIHEQFNALDNMRKRGQLREGIPLMDMELRRRGFHTEGMKDAVRWGWDSHMTEEDHYSEVFSINDTTTYKRSDLTTDSSLKLYTSLFPPDKSMATTDLTFITGKKSENKSKTKAPTHRTSNFVVKAAKCGIPITSHDDRMTQGSQPLFEVNGLKTVPAGFEMINEDMFARKQNKFMVFNGAGVDSWCTETSPKTKISGIESMLLGTL